MRQPSTIIVVRAFILALVPSRSNSWTLQHHRHLVTHRKLSDFRDTTVASSKLTAQRRGKRQSRWLFASTSSNKLSVSIDPNDIATLSKPTAETGNGDADIKVPPVITAIAQGTIVAQYPGGFTAIRINDANEFLEPSSGNDPAAMVGVETSSVSTPTTTNEPNKPTSSSTTSSMNNVKSNNIKLTSIDYQGKSVTYPNGNTGVVIAHRPPLVFCYTDSDNNNDNNTTNNEGSTSSISVMNDMVTISVSPYHLHVDGFGNSIDSSGIIKGDSDMESTPLLLPVVDRVIFGPIPKVSEIALINHPMITGNTMIDTLAPIGRGQNMLLIGSQIDDMRSIARDFLKTQIATTSTTTRQQLISTGTAVPKVVCVYASTEQNQTLAYQRIVDDGIADDIHYVGMKPTGTQLENNDTVSFAAEAVLVVNSAIAIAESYALGNNKTNGQQHHAVVVIDTIDDHKTLHDVTTRILVDTFGIQSVVQQDPNGGGTSSSEMRSFYSSFIQRAGQYNTKLGGGSVTLLLLTTIPPTATNDPETDDDSDRLFTSDDFEQCSEAIKSRIKIISSKGIPLTAATLRKINISLPTISEYDRRMQLQHIDELISMSDGQIWLDDAMPTMKPTMDAQKSITRIGVGADTPSRADAPAIRRVAEGIRLELIQSARSSMTGCTDVSSSATQNQIRRQQALLLAMYQPPGSPIRRLSDSCALLLAARTGSFLDTCCIDRNVLAGSDEGVAVIANLLQHVHTNSKDVMDEIDETLDLTDSSKMRLTASIADFFVGYNSEVE